MARTKPVASREHETVIEFFDLAATLRSQLAPQIDPDRTPSALPFYDRWVTAVAACGTSELYARTLDRSEALTVLEDQRPRLAGEVRRHNELGIDAIEDMRRMLTQFGRELEQVDEPDTFDPVLSDLESEFRSTLAEYDMKGSDAAKLMDQFLEATTVVRTSGLRAMPAHVDGILERLIEARRSDDRGSSENIPFWKVLIIAGAFGWWLAIALTCIIAGIFGGSCPTWLWALWAFVALSHFIAFLLFC